MFAPGKYPRLEFEERRELEAEVPDAFSEELGKVCRHGLFQGADFPFQFRGEFFFGRQVELIPAGEDLSRLVGTQEVFHHGIVFVGAEDEAKGRIVAVGAAFLIEIVHIKLHLAEIAVGELADLEIDQHMALQNGVIEDEIDVKVVAIESDPLLARDKGKALAEFEQEGLQVVDESLLQSGFHEAMRFRQSEEFDHDRIFEYIQRHGDFLPLGGELHQVGLVPALCQAFEEEAVDLAFQLAGGPV